MRRAVNIVYLDLSMDFDSVSHKILIEKLSSSGLDQQTARWIEIWLNSQAQRVVISDTKSGWRLATCSVPQRTVFSPVVLIIFIYHLDYGVGVPSESLLLTHNWNKWFTHNRVTLPTRDTPTGWANGLTGISWSSARRTAKSWAWGGKLPMHQYILGSPSWIGPGCPAGHWVEDKPPMHPCSKGG